MAARKKKTTGSKRPSKSAAGVRVKRARSERPRAIRRTITDKARTLASLKAQREVEVFLEDRVLRHYEATPFYTVSELARILGVSRSTVRRLRDDPNHKLRPETEKKIRHRVERQFREAKKFIGEGAAFVKGELVRHPLFRLPEMPVDTIPIVHPAKNGESFRMDVDVATWTEADKVRFMQGAREAGRFYAWSIRVMVPEGVSISGDWESEDTNEDRSPIYYMEGPYQFDVDPAPIIAKHQDAGRVVANFFLTQRREDLGL